MMGLLMREELLSPFRIDLWVIYQLFRRIVVQPEYGN